MINIIDSPYPYTPVGQRLILAITSTNSSQQGFRFVVEVMPNVTLYIQPNPSGTGIIDLCPLIREELKHTAHADESGINEEYSSHIILGIQLYEAWLVGGVFTIDPDGIGPENVKKKAFFLANYEFSDGYKPDPSIRYALNSTSSLAFSERLPSTHIWNMFSVYGLPNDAIYIPTRDEDWGIMMSIIQGALSGNIAENWKVDAYDEFGTPLFFNTYPLSSGTPDKCNYIGVYPQNLYAEGIGFPANWHYYTFYAYDSLGNRVSQLYTFYRVSNDCRFDNVRLMWTNTCGGVDYFNFTKRKEVNYNLDRKQYQKVIGQYNESYFKFQTYDRGITDRQVLATKGLVINSDWLSVGEFEMLKTLVISNDVFIVNDDGSQTPVIVTDTNYVVKDERYSKLFNLTLNLKFSQPVGI